MLALQSYQIRHSRLWKRPFCHAEGTSENSGTDNVDTKISTSLTHGIIWPEKLTTLVHETSWRGPIRKQNDFLKLISMSRSLSSRSQSFKKFSNAVTEGANNKISYVHFEVQCIYERISLLHGIVSSVAPIRAGAASPPPRQLGGQGNAVSSSKSRNRIRCILV